MLAPQSASKVHTLSALCATDSNWHVQVKGRDSGLFLNSLDGMLLVLLFCITVVSSISAVRYIAVDSVNYHVFANL